MWSSPSSKWKFNDTDFVGDIHDPERSTGPWTGHRNFAFDLISWRQPQVIAELGTHYGVSFFSFCQAVSAQADPACTSLHCIDTWEGEAHAGFYGQEVLDSFNRILEVEFSNLAISKHQKLFTQAVNDFVDESIDLIHIDGFHSYEALKEDFETWLPKLARNGVFLLHDVAIESGYGSAEYFKECILPNYPAFDFRHNFGLGVVFPKGTEGWEDLIEQSELMIEKYELSSLKRLHEKTKIDQTRFIDERDATIKSQAQLIDERDATIKSQAQLIDERDAYICELELLRN